MSTANLCPQPPSYVQGFVSRLFQLIIIKGEGGSEQTRFQSDKFHLDLGGGDRGTRSEKFVILLRAEKEIPLPLHNRMPHTPNYVYSHPDRAL